MKVLLSKMAHMSVIFVALWKLNAIKCHMLILEMINKV